jgi:zinc protease
VFGDMPYAHALSGTPRSLKAITRSDILGAYRAAWQPRNATLVLVGDITPARARALAEANFAGWTSAPAGPPPVTAYPAAIPAPRVVVVDMPGAGQAGVVVARPGISRGDPNYYPLSVANAGRGSTRRSGSSAASLTAPAATYRRGARVARSRAVPRPRTPARPRLWRSSSPR